jgi:hypothetical protein
MPFDYLALRDLIAFLVLWLWTYMIKVILETRCVHVHYMYLFSSFYWYLLQFNSVNDIVNVMSCW